MPNRRRRLTLAFVFVCSAPAFAADKCKVVAVLSGTPVTMKHCAAAVFDDEHSVTLYFSDTLFTMKELDTFHISSYATDKTVDGKPRTMMHFSFCPGGGKPAASAAAVKTVETSVNLASSFMASRQWVFELPKDKAILKIEKLTGNAVPGGKLSGRITGGKTSDGQKYSWEADFEVTLPSKSAAAGNGCGS